MSGRSDNFNGLYGLFRKGPMKARSIPFVLVFPLLAGCAHFIPPVRGVSAVSPSPAVPWTPPKPGRADTTRSTPAAVPDAVRARMARLTITDAVDLALAHDPGTAAAWANARSAAAVWAGALGSWLPDVSLSASATRLWSFPGGFGGGAGRDSLTLFGREASLSFLLFDFGGRAASVRAAKEALIAADWTHNAAIQNTVLETETAFFNFCAARALLEADRTSLEEAEANLRAAEEKRRVGLATAADALQARTARSEIVLAVLAVEGQVRVSRGVLADAMGYPANAFPDLDTVEPDLPAGDLGRSVDALVGQALSGRPDLQAGRALLRAAAADADGARSRLMPSVSVTGFASRTRVENRPGRMDDAGGSLLLKIPLFEGFSRQADWAAARAAEDAAAERTRAAEQAVILQVVAAHSDFTTADGRVRAAEDLVAGATQSEAVALGRYQEGVGSMLDLLTAQRALASARAERINARLSRFTALARLAHAAGLLGPSAKNPPAPAGSSIEVKP
jgi:outer membrane protein